MVGDARKRFMITCLSGGTETKALQCVKGKPHRNSPIAKDESVARLDTEKWRRSL